MRPRKVMSVQNLSPIANGSWTSGTLGAGVVGELVGLGGRVDRRRTREEEATEEIEIWIEELIEEVEELVDE